MYDEAIYHWLVTRFDEMLIVAGDNPRAHPYRGCLGEALRGGADPRIIWTTTRHRSHRGGHRQANAAPYRTVIVRMRFHEPTIAHVERRMAEGRTKAEVIRVPEAFPRSRDLGPHAAPARATEGAAGGRLTTIGASTLRPRACSQRSNESWCTATGPRPEPPLAQRSSSSSRSFRTAAGFTPRSGYLSPVEFERGSRRIGRTLQLPSPNVSTKAGQDQFGDHSPICEMPSGNGSTGSGKSVG